MQGGNEMKDLLEIMVKNLVTKKDEVIVLVNEDDNTINLNLQVAKEDIGKIIGKNGKIIRSIRTVVKAGAFNTKKRIIVEIME